MKRKKIIALILGSFVLVSIGSLIIKETRSVATTSNEPITKKGRRVEALYFHTTQRCYTCTTMEKYISEVIDEKFASQKDQGKLEFASVNVDHMENSHYVSDYKLYTKSFILSLKNDDKEERWVNCDKIWKLARNEDMFKKYITIEVNKFLGML